MHYGPLVVHCCLFSCVQCKKLTLAKGESKPSMYDTTKYTGGPASNYFHLVPMFLLIVKLILGSSGSISQWKKKRYQPEVMFLRLITIEQPCVFFLLGHFRFSFSMLGSHCQLLSGLAEAFLSTPQCKNFVSVSQYQFL